MAEMTRITWRFALGQRVTWGQPPAVYVIGWRRYHEGTVSRFMQYGLVLAAQVAEPGATLVVADEADLLEAEE